MSGATASLGGMPGGRLFVAPTWIDLTKPAGKTAQIPPEPRSILTNWLLLRHIFFAPNLVWLLISLTSYVVFPYDLDAAKTWSSDWVLHRVTINLGVMSAYYIFWEASLYGLQWSQRKFCAHLWPTNGKILHNYCFTILGTIQWALWEVGYIRLCATGQMSFIRDSQLLASPRLLFQTILGLALVPIWRGVHFYFAHRLIHINMLYKWVHSFHHRNLDIEPFSGLSMHPVEHLYYFSCIGPSLYFCSHPLVFLFNGMHCLLSPAASHSGWEDHWQSDQFHFLHHQQFECNYGSASVPLDAFFGTFREKSGKSERYTGAATQIEHAASADKGWKYQGVKTSAPPGFLEYLMISLGMLMLPVVTVTNSYECDLQTARALAAGFAFGPVALAAVMMQVYSDKKSARWPFHHEVLIGKFGLHLVIGFVVAVLPAYHLAAAVLAPVEIAPFDMWFGIDGLLCIVCALSTGVAVISMIS